MSWLDKLFGTEPQAETPEPPAPAPVVATESGRMNVVKGVPQPTIDKIEWNIGRFERALDQCGKGAEREAELRRNLEYWQALKTAHDLSEGI